MGFELTIGNEEITSKHTASGVFYLMKTALPGKRKLHSENDYHCRLNQTQVATVLYFVKCGLDSSYLEKLVQENELGFNFKDLEDAKLIFETTRNVFEEVLVDMIFNNDKKVECSWV